MPIGEWMLRPACASAPRWHEQGCALRVAVNLSAGSSTSRAAEHAAIVEVARASRPSCPSLLEITESVVMKDPERAAEVDAGDQRARASPIAIDDFGTGYSSLDTQALPDRQLKVDRSSCATCSQGDSDDLAITRRPYRHGAQPGD